MSVIDLSRSVTNDLTGPGFAEGNQNLITLAYTNSSGKLASSCYVDDNLGQGYIVTF